MPHSFTFREMRRWVVLFSTLVGVSGCGEPIRRPPPADIRDDRPSANKPDASTPWEPPIVIPGDDPCETVIELPIVKPNLYFVLDTSGSMLERMPDTNQTRHRTAVRAIESMLEPIQQRVNFGAAIFPSAFNGQSCRAGDEVFEVTDGMAQGNSRPLSKLITTLGGFVPEGGSPVSTTLRALQPTLRDLKGETFVVLLTDGAPNCNLAKPCDGNLCIPNIEGVVFGDGTACDENLNCCGPEWFPHLCLDSDSTLDELSRLTAMNISTYIIGLPGGAAYEDLLNQMAIAGGTARGQREPDSHPDGGSADGSLPEGVERPSDDGLLYYQVTDSTSLGSALASVRQDVLVDCTLDLDFAPRSEARLEVSANGEPLPQNAWQLVSGTQLELLGETCSDWKAGDLSDIRVRESCRGDIK